ncbi:hypothetical protein ACE5JW_00305 [Acinetobacter radioresistens]|jgi:hypothetical protein|uniref:MFS transporter n=1 Tax=Acinetobacter radioresistens SK82 TaxID=596318 RepID=A0ABP2GIC0_ACIRA|nr:MULTISPECIES: hypothetical protein [Acinetobacter]EET81381.1 hypothetical protein ACIRA0001_1299 [Acinetobacter radioresistens SK82]EEY86832.1 hypothetical protein HMPREF0018_01405 [Acinetobacter radioresistens SH164]ENV84538.1 hypothetical protein F940_02557 [Acinetobacter radioresistens NIPH 2130]EXB87337.1 hypothetical protein J538_0832 [Acinetobacter sp. 272263]EXE59034.1 hypothetical protein J579_0911 [Acinetobacter sp. 1239920]
MNISNFSLKVWLASFILVSSLIALVFWLYLNVQASLQVSSTQTDITLPHSLGTRIHVGEYLTAQTIGRISSSIDLDHHLVLPLDGKYLADLKFNVTTPVSVQIKYSTMLKINQVMPVETTTDLIYKNKLLPKFPLKLDVPVNIDVPFELNRTYELPIQIAFNGPVYFEFNQQPINVHVKHQLKPSLELNDPINIPKIANFEATMYNVERNTKANLDMKMLLPLSYIQYQ